MVGFGVFTLGQAGWVYELSLLNSIVFGALLSTTDPVATLAIFQTLNCPQVNPVTSEVYLLYLLYEYRSTNADACAILQTLKCPQMLCVLALGESVRFAGCTRTKVQMLTRAHISDALHSV